MPTYDYFCEANKQTVEVSHKMSELLTTWGELCDMAGLQPGATPKDSPVKKLITGSHVVNSANLKDSTGCEMANCCGGVCGMD